MDRIRIVKRKKKKKAKNDSCIWSGNSYHMKLLAKKTLFSRILHLWEFSCGFCEAEHGVKCGITSGRKSKPWVPIAVVQEDFYQRWNGTANYVRTTLFFCFFFKYTLCFIYLLYYSVNHFLMTSILVPNNIDLENTIKLISLQLKFV